MPKQYTDEQAAAAVAALKANRGNAKKTALQLGIPRTTLRQWVGRAQTSTGHPKQVPEQALTKAQEDLAAKWLRVADLTVDKATEAIENMDPKSLKAHDAYALLKGGGVATDKAQILTGNPTSRNVELKVVYVVPGALRDMSISAISGTNTDPLPVLEGKLVEEQDKP